MFKADADQNLYHLGKDDSYKRREDLVIEPGNEGTLIEAEERFGVGCGNERTAKAAARDATRFATQLDSALSVRPHDVGTIIKKEEVKCLSYL